jgi:hypothetical protein
MGYPIVLYIRLGAKIGDPYAKDFNSFRNRLISLLRNELESLAYRSPIFAPNLIYKTVSEIVHFHVKRALLSI